MNRLMVQVDSIPQHRDALADRPSANRPSPRKPKVLILTVNHGASHQRLGKALEKALLAIQPNISVKVVDALEYCACWFRLYYNSYKIPLKYWPSLWGWIENIQHRSRSTGPGWLYRKGANPLSRFIGRFNPDIVVATEVGVCELAAMIKRESGPRFCLVASPTGVEVDRAWAQPEVNLYAVAPGDAAPQLERAGVPRTKVLTCGMPVDPAFDALPDRATGRARLAIEKDTQLLLALFGGTGFGKPRHIVEALEKVGPALEVVFIAGRNRHLEEELRDRCQGRPSFRVFGWVDNMHEWMAAADLLLSKPGASTVIEAIGCGLPLLAHDPLPGNERRTCDLIEKWKVGYWVRRAEDLTPTLTRLLAAPSELDRLRQNARALQRPHAAHTAAQAILNLLGRPAW